MNVSTKNNGLSLKTKIALSFAFSGCERFLRTNHDQLQFVRCPTEMSLPIIIQLSDNQLSMPEITLPLSSTKRRIINH